MPVLNQRGDVCKGYGGGATSINGVPIGPGCMGVWSPATDAMWVGQRCLDTCVLADTQGNVLNQAGVNQIAAGGGRWASFTNFMLTDSARGQIPNEWPLAMDESGYLAGQNYLSDRPVTITRPDGSVSAVLSNSIGVATVIGANFRNGVLAFNVVGIGWSLFDIFGDAIQFNRRQGISQCVVTIIDGSVYLLEQDNNLLVTIRHAESWTAYILSQGQLAYHQDCRQLPNGVIRTVFSPDEGESSVTQRDYTLAQILALPTIDTSKPVEPPQPPVTPPGATNDTYLPLPLSTLPAARVGTTEGTPEMGRRWGNCYWSPSSTDDPYLPVGEGAPYESTMVGRQWLCVKWSTEKAAAGTLDQSIALAKRLGRPLEIHHDDVHDPAQIGLALDAYDKAKAAGVVPILQAHAVENVADFEHAARAFYAKDHRFNICVNLRVVGKDPDKFRAVVQKAEQLHRELRPVMVWFVGWRGAGPQMKKYVEEYCRLTSTP